LVSSDPTMSDRVDSDFTRQKITHRDFIGLWNTLLHLASVKVRSACSMDRIDLQNLR